MKNLSLFLYFAFSLLVALPSYASFWGETLSGSTFESYKPSAKPDGVDAKSYQEVEDQKKQLNLEIKDLNTEIETLRSQLLTGSKKVQEMNAKIGVEKFKLGKEKLKSVMGWTSDDEAQKIKDRLSEMESELSKNQQELIKKLNKIEEDKKKLEMLQSKLSAYNNASDRFVSLVNDIKAMKVLLAVDELRAAIKNSQLQADLVAEAFERVYERSLMAAYLQKKVEDLLNSKTLCEATKMCNEKGQASGLKAKEIFKEDPYGQLNQKPHQLQPKKSSRSTQ